MSHLGHRRKEILPNKSETLNAVLVLDSQHIMYCLNCRFVYN